MVVFYIKIVFPGMKIPIIKIKWLWDSIFCVDYLYDWHHKSL